MPWVRIDEHALNHIKIVGLSHGAFRLWVEGLAHCQKHLTDGVITHASLKAFRYVTAPRIAELATVVDNLSPLWERSENGYCVHDYLDWNDSRERVVASRAATKHRIQKMRSNARCNGVSNSGTPSVVTPTRGGGVECSRGSERSEEEKGRAEFSQRAGAFVEWYEDTHQRLFGIGYMGANRDWEKTLELCRKFTDQQMRDAAMVWFGHDDDFATNGTRTIVKFASRITGCLQQAKARGIA